MSRSRKGYKARTKETGFLHAERSIPFELEKPGFRAAFPFNPEEPENLNASPRLLHQFSTPRR
jgi:hypothetical protein